MWNWNWDIRLWFLTEHKSGDFSNGTQDFLNLWNGATWNFLFVSFPKVKIFVRFTVISVNFTWVNTFICFFQVRFIDQLLISNNLGKISRVVILLKSGFSPSFQWQLLDIKHQFWVIKLKIPQPRLPHSTGSSEQNALSY